MSKQYVFLLAESTQMRKHLRQMSKQYAFLLIEIEFIHFSDAVISYGDRENLTFKRGITEYSSFFEAKISWANFEIFCDRSLVRGWLWLNRFAAEFG